MFESNNAVHEVGLELFDSLDETTADLVVVDLVDPSELGLNSVVEVVDLLGDGLLEVSPCSFHHKRKGFSL